MMIKKIVLGYFLTVALIAFGGYFYFDRKFTPEKNYLNVKNETGLVKITWTDADKSALLLPIHFEKDSVTYFLQFDTGSPYTMFYKKAIGKISKIYQNGETVQAIFKIGTAQISSDRFKVIDYGDDTNPKIIGTLGADVMENRKTLINFKENYVELNLAQTPSQYAGKTFEFNFKKRKIIIPGDLSGKKSKFLYDSGTSAYELLTSKESWQKLKVPVTKIRMEKGNSWGNTLTTYTSKSEAPIKLGNAELKLDEVSYVEGYSKMQYYLIKLSGMSGGMLGNKLFLEKEVFFDCENLQMGIH